VSVKVFLSYRRGDSGGYTGRLRDSLAARLGPNAVFQDVEAIQPGRDFVATIGDALDQSDAVLAVIGPGWSVASGPDGSPRLLDEDDYVRRELRAALQRDLPVVPVLVGGASLPTPESLPEDIRPLLQRQAVVLRDASWQRDVDGLLESLRAEQAAASPRRRRRTLLIVGAIVLAALVIATVLVVRSRGSSSSASSLPLCPDPEAGGMTRRDGVADHSASDTGSDGGRLTFTVLDAHVQPTTPNHWLVLLTSRMTNDTSKNEYHAEFRYQDLAVDGTPYPLTCFNIETGERVVGPNLNSEAVVGFLVAKDPRDELTLVLENDVQVRLPAES
jgi:hypothetical protein